MTPLTDRLELKLDIQFGSIGTRAVDVRRSLTVANLIANVQDKFNLDDELSIRRSAAGAPLSPEVALDQAGVKTGDTLVVSRVAKPTGTLADIARNQPILFSRKFTRVFLRETSTLAEFDLWYYPAIIGRKDKRDPSRNRLLAVDLTPFEDSHTVSRYHACIMESNGAFFIEDIQGRNPVYVNGARIRPGERAPLRAGAEIKVGGIVMRFNLLG